MRPASPDAKDQRPHYDWCAADHDGGDCVAAPGSLSQPEDQIHRLRNLCDNLEARAEAAEQALRGAIAQACRCIDVMSGQFGRSIDPTDCPIHRPAQTPIRDEQYVIERCARIVETSCPGESLWEIARQLRAMPSTAQSPVEAWEQCSSCHTRIRPTLGLYSRKSGQWYCDHSCWMVAQRPRVDTASSGPLRVRIKLNRPIPGTNAGREGIVCDLRDPNDVKVQLNGDEAGHWWPLTWLEVLSE